MNISIRRLKDSDADVVSRIIGRNLREVNTKDYAIDEMEALAQAYNEAKIREMNTWAHSYVACLDDSVVGCGSIARYEGKEDESILLTIFVLPELHGSGIGTQIIHALENDEFFLTAKRIEIPSSTTSCDFYRRLGYDYKDGVKTLDEEGLIRLEK